MGSPCQTSYEARLFLRAQRGESIVIPNEPRLAQGQIELSDLVDWLPPFESSRQDLELVPSHSNLCNHLMPSSKRYTLCHGPQRQTNPLAKFWRGVCRDRRTLVDLRHHICDQGSTNGPRKWKFKRWVLSYGQLPRFRDDRRGNWAGFVSAVLSLVYLHFFGRRNHSADRRASEVLERETEVLKCLGCFGFYLELRLLLLVAKGNCPLG